jgi:hypothetical protein
MSDHNKFSSPVNFLLFNFNMSRLKLFANKIYPFAQNSGEFEAKKKTI